MSIEAARQVQPAGPLDCPVQEANQRPESPTAKSCMRFGPTALSPHPSSTGMRKRLRRMPACREWLASLIEILTQILT
jgi:hypothetical protein